ncbi:MAG: DUF3553 domain-containing protein [Phycisphaerales bacterium]|nr:DUF3553 domain-containing protein [Phycisphaerales bacterium]
MHRARPEWGVGSVTEAQKSVQDGVQCQRLTVRFEHGGLKTVSTAFAELHRVEGVLGTSGPTHNVATASHRNGQEGRRLPVAIQAEDADLAQVRERLGSLPDEAADPFRPLASRLRATVELYRYTDQGASLLAWATAMTGLADPLSRVSRHELEQAFARFEVLRDRHLAQLMQAAPREGIDAQSLIKAMPVDAQRALQRSNRRR